MSHHLLPIYNVHSLEDAFEMLEDELFEIKQFFLARPLLWKTAQPKLKRLEQLSAVPVVNTNTDETVCTLIFFDEQPTPEIWWKTYSQLKTEWKSNITQALTCEKLMELIQCGLKREEKMVSFVPDFSAVEGQPVFGKEPDPMILQYGFSTCTHNKWETWEEIMNNRDKLPFDFMIALKRLSLLRKYVRA